MGLLRETTPDAAARNVRGRGSSSYRNKDELVIRDAVDRWGRARWPEARVCHELVMDRGTVRADMAFITPDHLVAIEIKSGWDDTSRLLNQVAMFRLAVPELWVVVAPEHQLDAAMTRYLMPTVGTAIVGDPDQNPHRRHHGSLPPDAKLTVTSEATLFRPWPEATLALCWVAELMDEARRVNMAKGKTLRHRDLIAALLKLDPDQQLAAVCRQLRARNAFWRADPPILAEGMH